MSIIHSFSFPNIHRMFSLSLPNSSQALYVIGRIIRCTSIFPLHRWIMVILLPAFFFSDIELWLCIVLFNSVNMSSSSAIHNIWNQILKGFHSQLHHLLPTLSQHHLLHTLIAYVMYNWTSVIQVQESHPTAQASLWYIQINAHPHMVKSYEIWLNKTWI